MFEVTQSQTSKRPPLGRHAVFTTQRWGSSVKTPTVYLSAFWKQKPLGGRRDFSTTYASLEPLLVTRAGLSIQKPHRQSPLLIKAPIAADVPNLMMQVMPKQVNLASVALRQKLKTPAVSPPSHPSKSDILHI